MNSFPVLQRINKEGNYFEPSRCLYSITTFSFNVLPLFSAQRIMHPVDGALIRMFKNGNSEGSIRLVEHNKEKGSSPSLEFSLEHLHVTNYGYTATGKHNLPPPSHTLDVSPHIFHLLLQVSAGPG